MINYQPTWCHQALRALRVLPIAWCYVVGCHAQERLTFDFAHGHQFLGFGTQVWAGTQHRAERDSLLRDLQARFVRVSLHPGVSDDVFRGHMSFEQIHNTIDAHRDDPGFKAADQDMAAFSREVADLKLSVHLVSWKAPTAWSLPLPGNSGKYSAINPDFIGEYADLIMATLYHAGRFGVLPDEIEVTNEPHGGWDTLYSPAEYAELVAAVRTRLDSSPFASVRIEGPGASGRTAMPYVEELRRRGRLAMLANLSLHIYNRRRLPQVAGLANVPPGLGADMGPLLITEYNVASPDWLRLGTPPGFRGPSQVTDTSVFGVAAAAEALKLLADGAGSIFYWECEDQPWGPSS
jgi:O-glycosyl hydrolase